MLYSEEDEFGSRAHEKLKKPRHQRCFPRRAMKIGFLSVLVVMTLRFGYYVFGTSNSEYNLSIREQNFLQYLYYRNEHVGDMTLSDEDVKVHNQGKRILREHDFVSHLYKPGEADEVIPEEILDNLPVRGAFYMVVRNEDINGARAAIRSVEDRFNREANYPWVLLNDQSFSDDFKKYVKKLTKAPIFFGKIDDEVWRVPDWISIPRSEHAMLKMGLFTGVYQGSSLSFRQMLRYQSGFVYYHPLLQNLKYAWRVEPGSIYTCDMSFDPFQYMRDHNKTLSFTLTMRESVDAIPSLWGTTRQFMNSHSDLILPMNETIRPWILDSEDNYNMCHFWSNFEILDLDFVRSEAYQSYISYLDTSGGFFYERWGDAPIRTMAAAMFLKKEDILFFNQIGYSHSVASHCPYDSEYLKKCSCDVMENYDFHRDSCTLSLLRHLDPNELFTMADYARTHLDMKSDSLMMPLV